MQKVTNMAKGIVTKFGMSSLGNRVFEINQEGFSKNYSDEKDKLIDFEVNNIINDCAKRTREIVNKYSEQIKIIAEELLKKETIDLLDIIESIGDRPFPLPSSMQSYLKETKERKERERMKKFEEENQPIKPNEDTTINQTDNININKESLNKEINNKI